MASSSHEGLADAELVRLLYEDFEDYIEEVFQDESDNEFEDHESVSDHDSVSTLEESSDDDSDPAAPVTGNIFTGQDRITQWKKAPPPRKKKRLLLHQPECKGLASSLSESEAFFSFFDDHVVKTILKNTNLYITEKVKSKYNTERDARPITGEELRAFLGLLLMSGVLRASHPNFKDLFSSEDILNEFFHMTMSYRRFLFILQCLHFDNIKTRKQRLKTDKLAPVRELFDYVVAKCSDLFSPSENVTIDEQFVSFRERCSFKQRIPSKANKHGIKIFVMADTKTYYNINMEICVGEQPEGPYRVSSTAEDVVVRLTEPIRNSLRNITMDSWYNTMSLAKRLLTRHKLTLVGALRKNTQEIPQQFLPSRTRTLGSNLFGFHKSNQDGFEATISSHVPKRSKAVIVLSTLHNDNKIDKNSGEANKPEILTFYDKTKAAVDTNDQLCGTYSVHHRTRRWPLAIFFYLIDQCAFNAFVIFNYKNLERRIARINFLKNLSRQLVRPYQCSRVNDTHVSRNVRKRLSEHLDLPSEEEPQLPTTGQKKRCYVCPRSRNRHSKQICSYCRKNICSEHAKNLCDGCFFAKSGS